MRHTGQRRRIAGGQRADKGRGSRWGGRGGGGDVCQEGWLGSASEGTEGRKKVSLGIPHFSLPIYQSLPFPLPRFSHRIWTHSILFFPPSSSFQHHCWIARIASPSPSCPGSIRPLVFHPFLSFLSQFCISPRHLLSTSASLCVLTIFSLLHLFTGKELGARSVPVQSRLCHPTKRVGVKHRHRRSLPGRWHHIEANGCRET